jgi:hypothetical protein
MLAAQKRPKFFCNEKRGTPIQRKLYKEENKKIQKTN